MPQLSVLMPAFNSAPTIRRALTSTLNALPSDAELVVCDDASSDGTVAEVEAIPDRRVRLIRNDTNLGVAGSLQSLLDATDSEMVARMDSDDISLPWRFALERREIERGADVVFAPVIRFGEKSVRPQRMEPLAPELTPVVLPFTNPFVHSTLFARRAPIVKVGGYRNLPSEDYDLWIRLVLAGAQIRRIAVHTLLYRRHPAQVTQQKSWRDRAASDGALQQQIKLLASSVFGIPEPPREQQLYWFDAIRASGDGSDDWSRVLERVQGLPHHQRRIVKRLLPTDRYL